MCVIESMFCINCFLQKNNSDLLIPWPKGHGKCPDKCFSMVAAAYIITTQLPHLIAQLNCHRLIAPLNCRT